MLSPAAVGKIMDAALARPAAIRRSVTALAPAINGFSFNYRGALALRFK
jgi:hypothetical protein